MTAKREAFIVLTLGDRECYGFDEQTLPRLVALVDSATPDHREWHHAAVTGYFVASPEALERVERVIEQAEKLRISDPRLQSLGIGLATGEMLAEFTSLGRLKSSGSAPLGTAATEALRLVTASKSAYIYSLNVLRDAYRNA